MSVSLGTRYTFEKVFLNAAGAAADPTAVKFYLCEHVDGTELEWTYSAVAVAGTHYPVGMQPMAKTATGDYSVPYDARKPERVTGMWVGSGTVVDSEQQTLFVRHSEIASIDPPSS